MPGPRCAALATRASGHRTMVLFRALEEFVANSSDEREFWLILPQAFLKAVVTRAMVPRRVVRATIG